MIWLAFILLAVFGGVMWQRISYCQDDTNEHNRKLSYAIERIRQLEIKLGIRGKKKKK